MEIEAKLRDTQARTFCKWSGVARSKVLKYPTNFVLKAKYQTRS